MDGLQKKNICEKFPDFKNSKDKDFFVIYKNFEILYGNITFLLKQKSNFNYDLLGICIDDYQANQVDNAISIRENGNFTYKVCSSIAYQIYILTGNFKKNNSLFSLIKYKKDFTKFDGGDICCNGITGETIYYPSDFYDTYWDIQYMRTPYLENIITDGIIEEIKINKDNALKAIPHITKNGSVICDILFKYSSNLTSNNKNFSDTLINQSNSKKLIYTKNK